MKSKSIEKLQKEIEKKQKELTEEREEKLSPIAQEIIKLIAEARLPVGNVHAHDNPKFTAIAKNVLGELLDKEVNYSDVNFVFQLVLQPFDSINQIVQRSLKDSFNRAEAKLFGKDYLDVTLKDIDKIIKDNVT